MSKRVDRRRRDKNSSRSTRTSVPARTHVAAIDAGSVDDRLARLLDSPHLAQIVPRLAPEALHHLIQHRGLEACGAVLAASTPRQLAAILDLDLWRATPGSHDRFDERRFGSWIETLMEEGEEVATRVVAAMDKSLAVSGLSHYLRVFDPGVFQPTFSSDDDLPEVTHSRADSVESEVGGYIVRAKTTHAWDAIVGLLVALGDERPEFFHELMQGCKQVSNSIPEPDGLDDLLLAPEQLLHEVSLSREGRRTNVGYLTPGEARAFLQMARQRRLSRVNSSSSLNAIAEAYFRALDAEVALSAQTPRPSGDRERSSTDSGVSKSIDAVVDLLVQAGITAGRPRALLGEATADADARSVTPIQPLMEYLEATDPLAYFARSRELGFLANALLAG
ncbi:MAG TPA: DUF6178 family protein, partial [Gemmatimonadaceae bacterium]|nr:DUF6178 family protein [Gemmatimonadaceae bacterium]